MITGRFCMTGNITYLKNNLSAHGCVAKRFKMYCSSRQMAGLRFFTVSRLALNPNLIFEIGYIYMSDQ